MTTTPEGDEPSPMLGLKPLQEATEVFGRSSKEIIATQRATNRKLEDLNKTLNTLAVVFGRGSGTSRNPSGHSYGQLGGGASFGGQAYNGQVVGGGQQSQQPAPTSQPRQPRQTKPNGGNVTWGKFGPNQEPSITAPGRVMRFATAFGGRTPSQWGTQFNTLEMSAQVGSHALNAIGQRGLEQLDQEVLGDLIRAEELSYGTSWRQAEERGFMASLGSRSRTADTLAQTGQVGVGGRSSIQSMQDLYSGEALLRRFSGGTATQAGQDRKQSMMKAGDAFAYTNPTLSFTQSNQIASNMLKPSNRLNMMLMGLPDPTDSKGNYVGNNAFFTAFMKRIYQGRDHVPMNVFEDDFRETGVGWANLVQIVGEESAEIMVKNLRAFNLAKNKGTDTSNMDQLLSDAGKTGKQYDKARETLARDYGLKDTRIHVGNRQRVQDLASEMSGNEEYIEAERTATEAMHAFSDAVHAFINSPIIGDITNFLKGFTPGLMKFADAGNGGLLSILGMSPLSGQGPTTTSGSGGPAPVSGNGMESKSRSSDNLGAEIAKRASGYATGSRKYKYSMDYRNKDGYFDCSSFVSRVYKQFGYNIGPTTVQMWGQGEAVDLRDVQPGDLLLWAKNEPGKQGGKYEHVEMYIGGGKTVGTASAGPGQNTIQIQPYRPGDWDAARRIIGASKRGKSRKDVGSNDDTSSDSDTAGDGSILDRLGKAASKLFGGTPATGTAGTGSSVAGLGAGNAAAYSTSELAALMGILSGGGGAGPGPMSSNSSDEETGDKEKAPYEAKGTKQVSESTEGTANSMSKLDRVKSKKFRLDPNGKTRNYAPERHPQPNVGSNKAIAKGLLSAFGWGNDQWDELEKLWQKESGWNQYADNKWSDAYGIPQSLPGTKMASVGEDWQTNPSTQIRWGLQYIKGRYGSPTKAWAHSQAVGWYDSGAWQVQDDQVAVVHKDEMILPATQAQTIRDALIRENLGGKVTGEDSSFGSADSAKVELNFGQGAIVLQFGSDVSVASGRAAAQGFMKELEKNELYRNIARGAGRRTRA